MGKRKLYKLFGENCGVEGCKVQFTNLRMGGSQNFDSVVPMDGSVIDVMG
jgi:hypothetical protein